MLTGAMVMWWILTVPSVIFVAVDMFRITPEATVMKWAFVILTVFTGPLGAFFYVLGCREPLSGSHEEYTSVRWRQALGSTMHCAAGDGLGIIAGAAIGAVLALSFWPGFALEYSLGFGFGWVFFQAFAMRAMAGGNYLKSLKMTFLPEFVSMNLLMSGMVLTDMFAMSRIAGADDPANAQFWFVMSMALIVGFACAYPMNWWLVANHMKHGMLTVAPAHADEREAAMAGMPGMAPQAHGEHASHGGEAMQEDAMQDQPTVGLRVAMVTVSLIALTAALLVVNLFLR
jgi:hypothetical protein